MILRQVRRSNTHNAADNRYRIQALKILQRVGELDTLIEKAQSQLAAAPQSAKLMEDLAEYYTAAGDEEKARAAGCDDYDTNPVDLPRLLDKIAALIG